MKPSLVTLAAVAILGAGAFASARLWAAAPTATKAAPPPLPCDPADFVLYGHIKSMAPRGGAFELHFDPAWFTTGLTASRAKLADTGYGDVPNDNYVVEEGHRLLTYILPASARIKVLTQEGGPYPATAITSSELAALVAGQESVKLWEPLDTGVWINVHNDTVCSVEQQYQP